MKAYLHRKSAAAKRDSFSANMLHLGGLKAQWLLLLFFAVQAALANNPYQLEVSLKNALRDGDRYYFDLYVRQAGAQPVFLAFSDLAFDLQPNQAGMKVHYVAGSIRLQSASGLAVNFGSFFDMHILERDGQQIIMVNADASLNLSAQNYQHLAARIDNREGQHRLGRFYVSNYQGSDEAFGLQLRLNRSGANSKVFAFNPANQLRAEEVLLSFSQAAAGEQQAVKRLAAERLGNALAIDWVSAYEQNLYSFRIYRSHDGAKWSLLQEVAAHNNQQASQAYRVYDNQPMNGQPAQAGARIYYKIEAVGEQGVAFESEPKMIQWKDELAFVAYPNPARGEMRLRVDKPEGGFNVVCYDYLGRRVFEQAFDGAAEPVIDLYPMAAGAYIVQVQRGEASSLNKVVVLK